MFPTSHSLQILDWKYNENLGISNECKYQNLSKYLFKYPQQQTLSSISSESPSNQEVDNKPESEDGQDWRSQ